MSPANAISTTGVTALPPTTGGFHVAHRETIHDRTH